MLCNLIILIPLLFKLLNYNFNLIKDDPKQVWEPVHESSNLPNIGDR